MVNQEALELAVHAQPVEASTFTDPFPAPVPTDAELELNE
jgi:hypothetical protein